MAEYFSIGMVVVRWGLGAHLIIDCLDTFLFVKVYYVSISWANSLCYS